MKSLTLRPHPRLYIRDSDMARLKKTPKLPFLKEASTALKKLADDCVRKPLIFNQDTHNSFLIRARLMQTRVVSLLSQWTRTGNRAYRNRVISCIQDIHDWEYWSWIVWRTRTKGATAIYDLSYGENSATLAIAYDWMYDDLSDSERSLFINTAQKWTFPSALEHARRGCGWWFESPNSNWNSVCAGGLGMLCLAMYEECPEARQLLKKAEQSMIPFMNHLKETKGAWPEGIGYWNYGMRYAFMYLLSYENATGKLHPLMKHSSVKKTLSFPLDFCPNGVPCSFGDVNSWQPLPFHYRVAERLGATDIMALLDDFPTSANANGCWPNSAEWLLFHTEKTSTLTKTKVTRNYSNFYKGMDWGVLADKLPDPKFYCTVRGGTTQVPHGQRDLLSFFCVVGNESLIANAPATGYLDTTFSARREELFEIGPGSKNTIFINGVGICPGSELDKTEHVSHGLINGFRLIATTAFGPMRDGPTATFCGRLLLMLDGKGILIIDRFDLSQVGRVESRIHTMHDVTFSKQSASIRGKENMLKIHYASTEPSLLVDAKTAPTTPTQVSATQLRWCSEKLHNSITLATLITPGKGSAKVAVETDNKHIQIKGTIGKKVFRIKCSNTLKLTKS
ncbi:heparinase II/III family protein [bacterium AH-315-E10]|nr:heparinase II/III family protein [bacterium AH-315-E10]